MIDASVQSRYVNGDKNNEGGHELTIRLMTKFSDMETFELPTSCSHCPVGFSCQEGKPCGRNIPWTDIDSRQRPDTCKLRQVDLLETLKKVLYLEDDKRAVEECLQKRVEELEAREKPTPKVIKTVSNIVAAFCPKCGQPHVPYHNGWYPLYCPRCGQRIGEPVSEDSALNDKEVEQMLRSLMSMEYEDDEDCPQVSPEGHQAAMDTPREDSVSAIIWFFEDGSKCGFHYRQEVSMPAQVVVIEDSQCSWDRFQKVQKWAAENIDTYPEMNMVIKVQDGIHPDYQNPILVKKEQRQKVGGWAE